jgi:integrase
MGARTITITAMNSKTEKERAVGMTARLHEELSKLWEDSPKDPNGSVFGVAVTFKRAFAKACELAGVEGFRFHDCRHTATTRLVETKALHTQEAMKITGHTQQTTFARYVNPQDETTRRAAEALDGWLSDSDEPERTELIN